MVKTCWHSSFGPVWSVFHSESTIWYASDILKAENSNYLWLLRKVGSLISDSPSPPPRLISKDKLQLPNPATPAQLLLYASFTFPKAFGKAKNSIFLTVRSRVSFIPIWFKIVKNNRTRIPRYLRIYPKENAVKYEMISTCLSEKQWQRHNSTWMRCINPPIFLFQCLFWIVPPAEYFKLLIRLMRKVQSPNYLKLLL